MWIVTQKENTFVITYMIDEDAHGDQGITVSVITNYGETTKSFLSSATIGKIVPLYYRSTVVCNVCYLPAVCADEVMQLDAVNTLFFTKDGGVTCPNSIVKPLAVMMDSLMFKNPRDVVNTVIVDSMIDLPDNVIRYHQATGTISMSLPVDVKGVTVYRPLKDYPTLYTTVEEGLDVLQFADLEVGDVIAATYSDEYLVTEYTKVGAAIPAFPASGGVV